jgi:hypothetical protein
MSTKRHKGYNTIKLLIEGNKLGTLHQIFDHIPKTVVYKDLGINYTRFTNLIKRVQGFKLEELYTLSHLIGVDEKVIVDLAHAQYVADKKTIKKK